MKKSFILLFACVSFLGFSQEIGSAGKLFKNENRSSERIELMPKENYRWFMPYDYGYAEVFVRIPEVGRFTVSVGDQQITNSNGVFRFFDLSARPQQLTISYSGIVLYQVSLRPRNNHRMVFDFFSRKGLFLLEDLDLRTANQAYYGSQWNDFWNGYYGGIGRMKNSEFEHFFTLYKKEMFDREKLSFFQMQRDVTSFTTDQIAMLMSELSFDESKLTLAKEAYPLVADPQNYYKLRETFSFESGKERFTHFLTQIRKR